MNDGAGRREVPAILELAGHPVRWSLLKELARSDRHVSELTRLVDERQSLVSYHVGRLEAAGLVTSRRSSEDGRVTYYRADLERYRMLLAASGRELHPGLALVPSTDTVHVPGEEPERVLFLCTGNSARSQMAEALARHIGGKGLYPESAGNEPRPVHANAVKAMFALGLDIDGQRSKHLNDVTSRRFDRVITLCDRMRAHLPGFDGAVISHWSVADPVDTSRPDAETLPAFEAAAREISARVADFVRLVAAEKHLHATS